MLKFTRQPASSSLPLPPPFCLMYTFISTVSFPIKNRNQETRDPWPLSGPTSRSPALYVAQPPQLALLDPNSVPCRLLQSPFYAGSHLALTECLSSDTSALKPPSLLSSVAGSCPLCTPQPPPCNQGSPLISPSSSGFLASLSKPLSAHFLLCQEVILLSFLTYPAQ